MKCIWGCQRGLLKGFYNYGYFLGSHPYWFLVVPLLICGALACGFFFYNPETDIELLYAPLNSRAVHDRRTVIETFRDMSATNYEPFSQNRLISHGVVIFRSKEDKAILTDEVLNEIQGFYKAILALSVDYEGESYIYEDLCARRVNKCAADGRFIFESFFKSMLEIQAVTYPVWTALSAMDLNLYLSDVNVTSAGSLISAGSLKLMFPLKQDDPEMEKVAKAWELEYIKFMQSINFTTVDFAYSTSQTLTRELDKGTKQDILYFSLTFTFMIAFASIVSSGGDCLSTRALMANAGVVAVAFGILGAFGLITVCGVRFVNMVGLMPFLSLGIGVDDMFLLMSCWSESMSTTGLTVPERMGLVYRKAGIGITITSVTDFLAFAMGATSPFRGVRNFCIYSGAGVIFCYFCNACVFGACLALHGRRMNSRRHALTCMKVEKSRRELKQEGRSCCYVCMCGGKVPESPEEEQSIFEKWPRKAFVKFLLWTPVRCLVLLFFAGYLGVSIWGCVNMRQGLDLKDLVLKSSYFYKYQVWDSHDYGVKIPIAFVTTTTKDYWKNDTMEEIVHLLETAQRDPLIDPIIDNCWLTTLAKTPMYNTSNEDAFFTGLHEFLANHQPRFYNDIVFGADEKSITASRCHVYTRKITDSNDQAQIMVRMRKVADASSADVFAFHPAFVYFEQYIEVLPSTLQTVAVTFAAMLVATSIFVPHPLIVLIVMIQVVMIVVGIFGFMAHWGLTLSSINMIHLIMSVGFSVDFCAHVCTAYMVSDKQTRQGRAQDAITHASSAIFNGGLSSLVGVVVLIFTESYIFQSFFKITLLVVGFGMLHAVLLIPVVLSFIGPGTYVQLEEGSKDASYSISRRSSATTPSTKEKDAVKDGGPKFTAIQHDKHDSYGYKNKAFEADAHLGYLRD